MYLQVCLLAIKPDRFEAAKDVASQFISGRESDNIGMVIFAGESFTLVPMTTDRTVLLNYVQDIEMGMLAVLVKMVRSEDGMTPKKRMVTEFFGDVVHDRLAGIILLSVTE